MVSLDDLWAEEKTLKPPHYPHLRLLTISGPRLALWAATVGGVSAS